VREERYSVESLYYSKINVPFQSDGLKKLSHGGKGFPFPMLNATEMGPLDYVDACGYKLDIKGVEFCLWIKT